mgnify:CR=1 FL=1
MRLDTNPNIEAVIFDLDGVIVDTAQYHYEAWKTLALEWNYSLKSSDNEALKGVSRKDSVSKIAAWAGVQPSAQELENIASRKNTLYLELCAELTPDDVLAGIENLINELKVNNIKVALGSASKNAHQILKKLGIKSKFKVIIDGNLTSKSKPHPEVFLKGAQMLGVNPKKVIVFEDSIAGVEAANKAKMVSIAICGSGKIENARFNFNSLDDIPLEFFQNVI